jgi:hypothetical protein
VRGKNLYALGNQPVYTNVYGIGYHAAIVSPRQSGG